MQNNLAAREWNEWVQKLAAFRKRFGHTRVPPKWSSDPGLAKWVSKQRNEFHRLPSERLEELHRFGFDFGSDGNWMSRFFELVDFKREEGHCNVPINWSGNLQLGRWLSAQRLRKDHLLFPRRTLLDKLGMDWTPIQSTWNKRYTELQSFKDAHGHCNVPGDWPENPQLGLWVSNQRQRSHRLTTLQMRLLTRLGFDWNPAETIWKTHLRELREFKRRFGHHNVAPRWSENPALASWVADLRARGKKAVPARRRRDLDVLGFEWAPLRAQWWETHFRELQVFKKRLGHCNVPKDWPANPALGNWVSTQRTQRRELPLGRRRRLDQLGFTWQLILMSPRKRWEERYQELVAFKKRFGHCDVPAGWPENRPLAEWGLRQRTRDKSKLTGDQKRRLNELNFCWGRREANWEERFTELVAFKRKHGRSDVPKNWPQNPRLGQWVLRQRYRKHTLSAQRIDKLDRLGFRWPQNPARRRLRIH